MEEDRMRELRQHRGRWIVVKAAIVATTISTLSSSSSSQAAAKKKTSKNATTKPVATKLAAAPGKLGPGAYGSNVSAGNYVQAVGTVTIGLMIGKDTSLDGAILASGPTNVGLRIRQSQISFLDQAIVQIDPMARTSNGTEQPFPADYAAYLCTIPGVTVATSDVVLGGAPAQRVEFSITAKPPTGNPTYLLLQDRPGAIFGHGELEPVDPKYPAKYLVFIVKQTSGKPLVIRVEARPPDDADTLARSVIISITGAA
jgi:hypothetical protein